MDKYIIFTSAYNEENNIKRTIKSVLKQTILPSQWLIVNDGSVDHTQSILESYASDHKFITIINKEKSKVDAGAHVGINWEIAKNHILVKDWMYIAQLDADIEIDDKDFYEKQISFLEKNKQVGITSGITYSYIDGVKILTKRPYWRTGGATKFYTRECFEKIGGICPIFAWDGLDVYKARYNGWYSRTNFDLHVNHLGKARMLNREHSLNLAFIHGKNLYQRGFPLEFVILKSFKFLKRSFKQFIFFWKGYLNAIKVKNTFVSKSEKKYIRKFQYMRILDKVINRRIL